MSRSPIKAISSALQRFWPRLNPVETPVPVRRAPQSAPKVDFPLSALAQRTSVSTTMAGRTAMLPKAASHRPAGRAAIHPWVPPQWEARSLVLQNAVGAQLKAIKANNAVPGARIFGQVEMTRQLDQRPKEAERIKGTLAQRKAPPGPLGTEVWNSAQIARVPPATQPLRQMSNTALRQRRDALVLAVKAHEMSSRRFEKAHGHREYGHEILDREMDGYRREISRIDSLQAQRTRRH